MSPVQSPSSPSFPPPRSPVSPTACRPLETGLNGQASPPQLQIDTRFPFHPMALRSPVATSATASASPPGTGGLHRRNLSSASSLSFPSPIEAILSQPLCQFPTPLITRSEMSFHALGSPTRDDGRQSRMSMRPSVSSPILERILELPLRLYPRPATQITGSTVGQTDEAPEDFHSDGSTLCDESETHTHWTPAYRRGPSVSSSGSRSGSRSRENPRSAIRKPRHLRSPPPKYHLAVVQDLSSTLNNPTSHIPDQQTANTISYTDVVNHLATPLVPLISVTTGLPHPEFPRSLLQYHLMTHEQLDSLARWYHQTEPSTEESFKYPACIPPYTSQASRAAGAPSPFADVDLATKRRRWGRFIGLRGCESPTDGTQEDGEALMQRMERDWQSARQRAREEEMLREKGWMGRW